MIEELLPLSLCGALFAGAFGCARPLDEISNDEMEGVDPVAVARAVYQPGVVDVVSRRPPLSMQVTRVTGPGCPDASSWDMEQVPQGNAFTLTFHAMTLQVPAVQTPVAQETYCDLYIDVGSTVPVSYAVASFQYFGFASLQPGMTGTLAVRYGFTDSTPITQMPEVRHELDVPTHTSFAFRDDVVARESTSWSPCSVSSELGMRVRIAITSENRQWPGLLSLDQVDGKASEVRIDLASRTCSTGGGRITRR